MEHRNILVLNGPNLNLLGNREPEVYGTESLADINEKLAEYGNTKSASVQCEQFNHEGDLIDAVQQAIITTSGLIINPAGYTHTSVALADAVTAYPHPVIEVHLSNLFARETFRHHSYISPQVQGVISGLGSQGYLLALQWLLDNESMSFTERLR